MNGRMKKLITFLTAFAILALTPLTALAAGEIAVQKEEVVYVSLNGDGSFGKAYVVNSFDLKEPGRITDYGGYDSVSNLSTTDKIECQGDAVSVDAPAGRFYYQGNLSRANLPWLVSLSYDLGGKPVQAADLAGASGDVGIHLRIRDNPEGEKTFAENYMLQISMTFDTEICSNITAGDATIALNGKNKIVNFIKFPGGDADFTVRLDAKNFEMKGIQMGGIPLSLGFDTPDISEFTDGIRELQDGIGDLNSGAKELNSGAQELSGGTQSMSEGLATLENGMKTLQGGFFSLVGGNTGLQSGSQQILDALNAIKTQLAGITLDTSELTQLAHGSTAVSQGITQISDGLGNLKGSFALADQNISAQTGGAYAGLQDANAGTIAQLNTQIAALTAADPVGNAAQIAQLTQIVGLLTANNQLVSGLKTGISGDGTAANPGLAAGAASLSAQYAQLDAGIQALPSRIGQLAAGMSQLKSGIDQLASNYSAFHGGIVQYTNGVRDVYNGYEQLVSGYSKIVRGSGDLSAGAAALSDGTQQFSDGTNELNVQTKDMDAEIQDKIDEFMETYTGGDFTPVSFVSAQNTNVNSVQFVIMTPEIKNGNEQAAKTQQPEEQTFWQKLLALFGIHAD